MSFPTISRIGVRGSKIEAGGWKLEPTHPTILYPLSSILYLLSSILYPLLRDFASSRPCVKNWSPRRDLNSHKTLTAGVALPLSYAGSYETAGRTRTCIDEFRKLAPDPFGHGSDMVETMGLEPIHRVCRTRMPPTTSSPHVPVGVPRVELGLSCSQGRRLPVKP
jgi:hypothetical protein